MLEVYVKNTSNCRGLPLQTFEVLSPEWVGESLVLPFGPKGEERYLRVVGWTDLFSGSPCPVRVARVRHIPSGAVGYLVRGGNAGVRVLDDEAPALPGIDDHLPPGWGQPIIWVESLEDFPPEVQAAIAP